MGKRDREGLGKEGKEECEVRGGLEVCALRGMIEGSERWTRV